MGLYIYIWDAHVIYQHVYIQWAILQSGQSLTTSLMIIKTLHP